MNLWRIPRMEVESPTLLVYELTLTESASQMVTGDVSAQLASIGYTIKVSVNPLNSVYHNACRHYYGKLIDKTRPVPVSMDMRTKRTN